MTIDQLRISSSNNITGSLLRLASKQSFPTEAVANSAGIIRGFIEEYHEKKEQNKFGEDGFASIVDKVSNIEKTTWDIRTCTVYSKDLNHSILSAFIPQYSFSCG